MYKLIITEKFEQDIYEKFIDYAILESDAFMLVVYRDIGNLEEMFSVPPSRLSLDKKLQLKLLKYDEEEKKRKYKDIATFKEKTEPFLKKLKPYLIKKRNFPVEWPGIKTEPSKYQSIDICVYSISKEVKNYLLEPKGIFNWKYPYFPDDLCFFKNGYCWFSTVAHEGYACAYIHNPKEVEFLEIIGIKFRITQCDITNEQLFFEDYSL